MSVKTKCLKKVKELDHKLEDLFLWMDEIPVELLSIQVDGQWSILQICEHLRFSENSSLGYVKHKLSKDLRHPKISLKDKLYTFMLGIALSNDSKKYRAPKIEGLSPGNNIDYGILKKTWVENRIQLWEFLDGLDDSKFKLAVYKHPRTGPMGIWQMLQFFDFHFDRHKRQMADRLAKIETA